MKKQDIILATPEDGEVYAQKPTRKPDIRLKGRLTGWIEEGQYQFSAGITHPEMKREVLVDKKNVKVARTPGEKESTIILTAKVDANSADPYGTLLDSCVKELGDKASKLPKYTPTGMLFDNGQNLKVWQRKKEKKLVCHIELDASKDKELIYREFSDLQTEIFKTISATKF